MRSPVVPRTIMAFALVCPACLDWQIHDEAVSFYVATTGSDETGDGSKDRPWATIAHADQAMVVGPGGVVVHVQPGDYRLGKFSTKASGAPSGRVRFVSDGHWGARLLGSQWWVGGSYTNIEGFDLDGEEVTEFGVSITDPGVDHTNVIGNRIRNTCNHGCCSVGAITVGRGSLVMNNVIDHIGPPGPADDPCSKETRGIAAGEPDITIQNNIISDVSGDGILMFGKTCRVVVSNNTVDGGHESAISLAYGGGDSDCPVNDYNTIINNIGANSAYGPGISFKYDIGSNNFVSNNLLYGNGMGGYAGDPAVLKPQNSFTDPGQAVDNGTDECAMGASPCVPGTDIDGKTRPQGAGYDIGAHEE